MDMFTILQIYHIIGVINLNFECKSERISVIAILFFF